MDISLGFLNLTWLEAIFRVSFALLFGFCIGYERNCKNKPVDYRVYMVVAATTCLLAMMGEELSMIHNGDAENIELGMWRIIQGVLTGIGFLGAGAIIKIKDEQEIIGTTTGASIWGAGAIGLMIGFGLYALAILGFGVLGIILVVFGFLKKPLFDDNDKC
jgi:putative Mg2+ transporter-C (MgtC) family protein